MDGALKKGNIGETWNHNVILQKLPSWNVGSRLLVLLSRSELAVSKQTSGIPNYTIITDMSSQAAAKGGCNELSILFPSMLIIMCCCVCNATLCTTWLSFDELAASIRTLVSFLLFTNWNLSKCRSPYFSLYLLLLTYSIVSLVHGHLGYYSKSAVSQTSWNWRLKTRPRRPLKNG